MHEICTFHLARQRSIYSMYMIHAADAPAYMILYCIPLETCITIALIWTLLLAHAGLCQLSRFRQLRHLSLEDSLTGCTHGGLIAALATMTGAVIDHNLSEAQSRSHTAISYKIVGCRCASIDLAGSCTRSRGKQVQTKSFARVQVWKHLMSPSAPSHRIVQWPRLGNIIPA